MDIKSEAKHCSIFSEVLSQEIPKGYEIPHVVYRITVIWVEESLHFPADLKKLLRKLRRNKMYKMVFQKRWYKTTSLETISGKKSDNVITIPKRGTYLLLRTGSKHKENNKFQYEDPSNIKNLILYLLWSNHIFTNHEAILHHKVNRKRRGKKWK